MAYNFKEEEEVKEFLKNLAIEYRFGCFYEKKSEVCDLLGDYFEAISKDFEKALAVYKNNCDTYNYPLSCYKTGAYFMQGKAIPKIDDEKAMKYLDKGCKLENWDSCYRAATLCMYTDNENVRDYSKGLTYYEKACENGNEKGCYDLSSFYIGGDKELGIAKNKFKGFYYSKKACDLDNETACFNLSRMYALGDGVMKDLKLARKYRAKAEDLKQQLGTDRQIPFQVGIDPVS